MKCQLTNHTLHIIEDNAEESVQMFVVGCQKNNC